jgi:diguanylate cyclase (GGDEF)-like protein
MNAAADPRIPPSLQALVDEAAGLCNASPLQALALAEQAVAQACADGGATARALALWARGVACSHAGRYAQAFTDLEAAHALLPPEPGAVRARVLRGLSIAYEQMGALDRSLEWALKAVEAAREAGDERLRADCLLSVGIVYSRCGDPEQGLAHYRQVLALYEAAGELRRCVGVLNNMGINLKNLGRFDAALEHFDRAAALALSQDQPAMVLVLQPNRAEVLWRLGRAREACEALRDAVPRFSASGHHAAEMHARVLLGRVLHDQGEADAAREVLEQALRVAVAGQSLNYVAQAHLTLSLLHKAAGRFDAALHHHEAYHAAERAQFNEESDRRLRVLKVRFELAEAQQQARTDALTGLLNRRHLDERLQEAFEAARRHGRRLAVALCDIDSFKRINDRFGHLCGDEVLRRVAAVLRRGCRPADLVARYGGEEFCIVFADADAQQAATLCESLRIAVAAQDWEAVAPGLAVTLSIGLSDDLSLPGHEPLLAAADTMLYEAKHRGKNQVRRPMAAGAA